MESVKLGLAVPQVLAHRLARMDPVEFQRMGVEKIAAFYEAWGAMAMQSLLESQKPSFSFMRVLAEGMRPVRRRAVANAKRLRRRRR